MPTPTIRVSQLPAIGTPDDDNLLLVSTLSPTVTITATTISAQASDNSFNDSANGFGAFAVDDQIQVTGFTGNVANNLYSGTVTAATIGKLTIGGTDGDVIVDDAAGESVTITKWESVRMTLADLVAFIVSSGVDAADVTYTVADAGDWTGSPVPDRVAEALDEVAARITALEAAPGAGDVTAAANLTDNAIVRGDGGTKGVQTSGVLIDDDNKISGYRGNINTQTGTSYTLDAADTGKIVELSNASAIALTLPATAAVGFACTLVQAGAGQVTFASTGSGTVRNRQSHTKLAGQWAMASAYVRSNSGGSAAEWVISGDTTT